MTDIIDELKRINSNKIKELETSNESQQEVEKHYLIKKILDSSKNCFLEIPMETSLQILSNLIDENKIKEVYENLISFKEFKKIQN